MAIVNMKRLRVIAMAAQREELLQGLLRLGCVEISEAEERLSDPQWAALLRRGGSDPAKIKGEIAQASTALEAVKRYGQAKGGLFIQRRSVPESEFLSDAAAEKAKAESERIGGLLRELSRLETEENRLESRRAGLLPWRELDMPLEQAETACTSLRLEVCPAGVDLEEARAALTDMAAELLEISTDQQQRYTLLICHKSEAEQAQEALRPFNFSAVSFQGFTGTAAENIAALDGQLKDNRAAQAEITGDLQNSAGSLDDLRLYADRLTAEAAKDHGRGNLLTDGTIVFFEGWMPEERAAEVGAFLDESNCA